MSSFNTEVTIDSKTIIENVVDSSLYVGSSADSAPLPSKSTNDPTLSNTSGVVDTSNKSNNIENIEMRGILMYR